MSVPPDQMQPGTGNGDGQGMPPNPAPPAAGDEAALDTAATAKGPQTKDPQEEYFATLVAGLRNHIFGRGEGGIVRQLAQAEDVGRVLGELTYALVSEGVHQLEAKGVREIEYDMVMGVATEVIDDISELMEAQGKPIDQQIREYALLFAQQLYIDNQKPSDDQRKAASQDLALLKQGGDVDTAVKYVQQTGAENGTDPFDVAGMDGGAPKKSAGLMGAGNDAPPPQ